MAKSQSKAGNGSTDATKILADDHRMVERIVEKFSKLKDGDIEGKEQLVREACNELKVHAIVEEEIFYPSVRRALDDGDVIDEAKVEHAVVKQLIGELEEMSADDELYDAKFTVLGEYVKHHVAEEEGEMFPLAKRAKVDMEELGAQIRDRKEELLAEMAGE